MTSARWCGGIAKYHMMTVDDFSGKGFSLSMTHYIENDDGFGEVGGAHTGHFFHLAVFLITYINYRRIGLT